ncbi:MAG: 2,3-bisphosphoglycerate-independent phosphoglycerate mutase [Candidatus Margulisbacteria bacterium]|nr:2,3-bisphosphoglycerate-independent phosphoglycerate mutase [Candidatus Margulisiibacteriota bacterium]
MTSHLTLSKLPWFQTRPGPVLLVVMDGIGIGKPDDTNAVHLAHTPVLDKLIASMHYRTLKAHGTAVGMPTDEDMGNSEVGHNVLGAGRIYSQGASLVKQAVETGQIYQSEAWKHVVGRVTEKASTLHFIGLLSDGNVHSHISHLLSLLDQAFKEGVQKVRVHILLDGRDVEARSAVGYIDQLENKLKTLNQHGVDYCIASGGGRMVVTMDRYNADWPMVERGWLTHVLGDGRGFTSAKEAVETGYENPDINDQYLPPFVIQDTEGKPLGKMNDGDAVICFNFRGDRVIELSKAFEEDPFDRFDRGKKRDILYVGMMEYDGDLHIPKHFLVPPAKLGHPLSEYVCGMGLRSFAISETQKFGHVTYFWNGNRSGYIDEKLETYVEIPSKNVPFDEAPEMRAHDIAEKVCELMDSGNFEFGRVNFPNGDMVGHTGNKAAIIEAVEVNDRCVGRLVEKIKEVNGIALILADHGNAEELYTPKGGAKTSHSLNPVPFAIVDPGYKGEYEMASVEEAGLSNVAATICHLMGYEKPEGYDPSLIQKAT